MYVTIMIKCHPVSPLVRVPERAVQPGNRVWFIKPGLKSSQGELGMIQQVDLVRSTSEEGQTDWIIDNTSGAFQPGQLVVVQPFTGGVAGDMVTYFQAEAATAADDEQGEETE